MVDRPEGADTVLPRNFGVDSTRWEICLLEILSVGASDGHCDTPSRISPVIAVRIYGDSSNVSFLRRDVKRSRLIGLNRRKAGWESWLSISHRNSF